MKSRLPLISVLVFLLLPAAPASGQRQMLIADSLRSAGRLKEAIGVFREVYAERPGNMINIYNLACALALDGQKDSAFAYLDRVIALHTTAEAPSHALTDPDFLSLHGDARWAALEQRLIASLQEKTKAPTDVAYARQLWQLAAWDQAYYTDLEIARNKHGRQSAAVKAIEMKQEGVNRRQVAELEALVAEKGWPKKSQVGTAAATAAFLVIQHATLQKQQQYLPTIEQLCREGEARWDTYAMMYDRVQVRLGKPQRYGTQSFYNEATKKYELYPLEDKARVAEWRSGAGIGPIAVPAE